MILRTMRIHLRRPLGRALWVALLACAGLLPLLHAAHHLDSSRYCTVCHFARGGVPALPREPLALAPPVVAVPAPARSPDFHRDGPRTRTEIIRGPPVSSRG